MLRVRRITVIALATCATSVLADAQCADWSAGFELGRLNGIVRDGAVFDDGSGPALYLVGAFTAADVVSASRVARWDGQTFTSLGSGFNDVGQSIAVYDDGGGAALYVGGAFTTAGGAAAHGIARWDGSNWSAVGGGLSGNASDLVVFDDGGGAELYAGGLFTTAGGITAWSVARWDGSSWSAMPGAQNETAALAVFDDGNGPKLYAALHILGNPNPIQVARWTGANWQIVGATGAAERVYTLEVHDDGNGPALYAGGDFHSISGVSITNLARWRGGVWSSVGGAADRQIDILRSFADGNGAKLYAGGRFQTIGGVSAKSIASWDGASWSACGGGMSGAMNSSFSSVYSLTGFDDGSGAALYAGGNFSAAGSVATTSVAKWNGAWHSVGNGGNGVNGTINALEVADLGAGGELYAAGSFTLAGDAVAQNVASWNGTSWSALGGGLTGTVRDLCVHDDGSGAALYAVGSIPQARSQFVNNVARWNGSAWSQVGGGISTSYFLDNVTTAASFDDGNGAALYVGGLFEPQFVTGGGATLVFWRSGAWHELSAGEPDGVVRALVVFDDDSGPALYAGGDFDSCGNVATGTVAKWDGSSWSDVGGGVSGTVRALASFDDGSGPALYAGGTFSIPSHPSAVHIAKWDGSSWSALGSGCNSGVFALAAHDDGTGAVLYAAGNFTMAGGGVANHIARWNGTSWSALGAGAGGAGDQVFALASFNDGPGATRSLYAAGSFAKTGISYASNIARWTNPCACSGTSYCTSGTTSHGCLPTISGVGAASASATSGFTISVSSVEGQKQGHLFYGVSGPNAAPWGASSHFLCVKAPTQRTGTQDSGGIAGACDGVIALDWNAYVATHPGSLGTPFSAGTSVWAQLYFRDPAGPKTTALSNALTFSVCP